MSCRVSLAAVNGLLCWGLHLGRHGHGSVVGVVKGSIVGDSVGVVVVGVGVVRVALFTVNLSWKCRRHVAAHCRHDMTCRSNFGQMGPCRRHEVEDVVAVCVGLSRHLPNFPKCVCRNILWYGSTYAQILSHLSTLISVMFSILCSPVCHVLAGDKAHPHTTDKREHSQFNYTMNSAPQHHPPMPPTKAMGAITQNRRGHPTATP